MHVVATRGMQFWAELGETVYNKPRDKMVEMLNKRRACYTARLNHDYMKVWFSFDYAANRSADNIADISYLDVLRRLLELLHPARKAG